MKLTKMGYLPAPIALSQGLVRSPAEKDRATIKASLKTVRNFIELFEDLHWEIDEDYDEHGATGEHP
jgi:hypothetical protein